MKRIAATLAAAALLSIGAAATANAEGPKPPIYTPATTCMNCK